MRPNPSPQFSDPLKKANLTCLLVGLTWYSDFLLTEFVLTGLIPAIVELFTFNQAIGAKVSAA
jgi:hypothetical protein